MSPNVPSKFCQWLILHTAIKEDGQSVYGDMVEIYRNTRLSEGPAKARIWFLGQTFCSVPRFVNYCIYWRMVMFFNYFKIAFRNLWQHKAYSLINIVGLTVGMALFILAMLYAEFNLSFDRFHKDSDRIYMVTRVRQNGRHDIWSPLPIGQLIREEVPAIEEVARFDFGGGVIRYDDKTFLEEIRFVDGSFLRMFLFPLIKGDPANALDHPNSAVITEQIADKYFGSADPLGKTLVMDDTLNLMVTGVIQRAPKNSSIDYDILVSLNTLPESSNWNFVTISFVRLAKGIKSESMAAPLTQLLANMDEGQYKPKSLYLFPFKELFFMPMHIGTPFSNTPKTQFFLIIGIAAILLLVVCLNFMNLATARYMNRAKEVGLRKVVGAVRSQLINQFLGESVLIAFIALPLGLLLYLLIRQPFQTFMRLDLDLFVWSSPRLMALTVGITLLIGLVSGSYPAFFLSSFRPTSVLRGTLQRGQKGERIRKGLVVTQFVLSVVLIVFALVVREQFSFLLKADVGYNRKDLLGANFETTSSEQVRVMKNELLQHPDVQSVTQSNWYPVDWGSPSPGNSIAPEGGIDQSEIRVQFYPAPVDFIETLQLRIVKGRSFSRDFNEALNCIVSETTARLLGYEDPIGKRVKYQENFWTIVGVVKDFHFKHMFHEMSPTLLYCREDQMTLLLIRCNPGTDQNVEAFVEKRWKELVPNFPVYTELIQDRFTNIFKITVRGGELIYLFSIIAIFFSCLGLLGLASYTIERRTKEIAVRKVLGANLQTILGMLMRNFLFLVALGNLIAWPIAYFASHWFITWAWVYQTSLGVDVFLIATGLSLVTAIIAVTTQSIKAALAHPAKALRIE